MCSLGLIEFHDREYPNPAKLRIGNHGKHGRQSDINVLDEAVP